jgi:hypothetical protein
MVPTRSLADVQMSGMKYLHLKGTGGVRWKQEGKGKDRSTHLLNPVSTSCCQGVVVYAEGPLARSLFGLLSSVFVPDELDLVTQT